MLVGRAVLTPREKRTEGPFILFLRVGIVEGQVPESLEVIQRKRENGECARHSGRGQTLMIYIPFLGQHHGSGLECDRT
jgi:hypothetical protein